jgi:FkbM family methyltransferase
VDVGMNLGWYTLVASQIAPDMNVLGIDMQPRCVDVAACGLQLNSPSGPSPAKVEVLARYVSSVQGPAVSVPSHACDTMASPSAVAGRRPNGKLRGTMSRLNTTHTTPVPPILLGRHLLARLSPGERVAVVKIDTEGYETCVMESLRPVWPLLEDVVFELQPQTWTYHGVDLDAGIATLRALITQNRYLVVSLPHIRKAKEMFAPKPPELVDACRLPRHDRNASSRPHLPTLGLHEAAVYNVDQFEAHVRRAAKRSHFTEFLLTRDVGCI